MGTLNYDFTYLVGSNPIDLVGDTTTFLDEIDAQIKYVADNAIVQDGGVTTQKLADGAVTTIKIDDAAVTTAKIADSNVTSNKIADGNILTAKIADDAVTTGKIADNSITTPKLVDASITNAKLAASSITTDRLTTQTLKDIVGGITIHHFDSKDANADNTGLATPSSQSWLEGIYVEEWKMLIINNFIKASGDHCGGWMNGNTGFKLPSYVPNISGTHISNNGMQLSSAAIMTWDSNNDFISWTAFGLNVDGSVGPNTATSDSNSQTLMGCIVSFLGAYGGQ